MTRAYNKRIETAEQHTGQLEPRVLHSDTGTLDAATPIQVMDKSIDMLDKEKMKMLAFFNEPVTIRIATSSDRQAEQAFEINVNGQNEFFRRGETKTVKRFIVDHMARMKVTTYTQREVIDKDGVKSIVNDPVSSLKYDFSIERDSNPRGRDWLRAVQAEA